MSWGEGSSSDGGLSISNLMNIQKRYGSWETEEFYFIIAYQENSEGTWYAPCKTSEITNGYDVSADYCKGDWGA
jgi:hypothetical protein